MLNYDLKGKNKYYTLYCALRDDILRGKFRADERLPAKRVLAEELGVSVVTVRLAYEQLLAEGYIRSKERSGYFVEKIDTPAPPAARRAEPAASPAGKRYRADFVKGSTPADLFPFSVWTRLTRAVLADCGEHLLERVPCDGDAELKAALSAYLYRARNIDVDPRYIVVGAGAEHLYGVVVQLLGREKVYAVENPGYGKISSAYALNGARCVPVKVTESGMDLDALEGSGADVAHVSPSHQFPTGAVMPASARSRLIAWANAGERYIVEDDYDSEFRLVGRPLQCTYGLCPDKVIYMNTFSKSLAPSMRMGYMVLPPALYETYTRIFGTSANFVPLFEQKTLAAMLDGGYFERHIQRLKHYYREIRQIVRNKLAALGETCEVYDTGSGLHLLAKFASLSDGEIKARAEETGVRVKCLSDYLLGDDQGLRAEYAGCAVVNYSGVTPEELDGLSLSQTSGLRKDS